MPPPKKITVQQFAASIKEKYPAYKDVNDDVLTKAMIEKYPVYADRVEMNVTEPTSQTNTPTSTLPSPPPSNGNTPEYFDTKQLVPQGGGQQAPQQPQKPIAAAVKKDKPQPNSSFIKTIAGIYNSMVGSVSSLAGGIGYLGETATNLGEKGAARLLGVGDKVDAAINVMSNPEAVRKGAVKGVEKLRSSASTKADEEQLMSYDVSDGVGLSDIGGFAASIPKMATDIGAGIISAGSSFVLQSVNDSAEELDKNPNSAKMSDGAKLGYIFTQAAVQAALEKFSLDKILKGSKLPQFLGKKLSNEIFKELTEKGGKYTAKQIEELAIKKASSFASKMKRVGKSAAEGFIVEGGTEGGQTLASDGIKLLTNKAVGEEIFDANDILQNMGKNALNSTVGGGLFGGGMGGVSSGLNNTNKAIRKGIAEAQSQEDIAKIQQDINEQVEAGNITEEEAQKANIKVGQYAEIAGKIPAEITPEKKYAIIGGIEQREGLKADIEKLQNDINYVDPAFQGEKKKELELLQGKLGQVNDYINELVTDEKTKYVEKDGKYFKVDANGEQEINKSHYDMGKLVQDAPKEKTPTYKIDGKEATAEQVKAAIDSKVDGIKIDIENDPEMQKYLHEKGRDVTDSNTVGIAASAEIDYERDYLEKDIKSEEEYIAQRLAKLSTFRKGMDKLAGVKNDKYLKEQQDRLSLLNKDPLAYFEKRLSEELDWKKRYPDDANERLIEHYTKTIDKLKATPNEEVKTQEIIQQQGVEGTNGSNEPIKSEAQSSTTVEPVKGSEGTKVFTFDKEGNVIEAEILSKNNMSTSVKLPNGSRTVRANTEVFDSKEAAQKSLETDIELQKEGTETKKVVGVDKPVTATPQPQEVVDTKVEEGSRSEVDVEKVDKLYDNSHTRRYSGDDKIFQTHNAELLPNKTKEIKEIIKNRLLDSDDVRTGYIATSIKGVHRRYIFFKPKQETDGNAKGLEGISAISKDNVTRKEGIKESDESSKREVDKVKEDFINDINKKSVDRFGEPYFPSLDNPEVKVLVSSEVEKMENEKCKSNKCETNVYELVKENPEKYYPVRGYFINKNNFPVEHWWLYDRENGKHIEITPDEKGVDIPKDYVKGYVGVINKDINAEIVKSEKVFDVDFFKSGQRTQFKDIIAREKKSLKETPKAETPIPKKETTEQVVGGEVEDVSNIAFNNWRISIPNKIGSQKKILHNKIGEKLSEDEANIIIEGLQNFAKSKGESINAIYNKDGGYIQLGISDNILKDYYSQQGAESIQTKKYEAKKKEEEDKKAERERIIKEQLGKKSVEVNWINDIFGEGVMNDFNTKSLVDFITGKEKEFKGLVNPKWENGLEKIGAIKDGNVDFSQIKKSFEQSLKETPQAGSVVGGDVDLNKERQRLKTKLEKLEYNIPNSSGKIRLNKDGSFKEYGDYENGVWRKVTDDVNIGFIKNDYEKVKKLYDIDIKLNDLLNSKLSNDLVSLKEKLGGLKELKKAFKDFSFEQIGSTANLDMGIDLFLKQALQFNKLGGVSKAVESLLSKEQSLKEQPKAETSISNANSPKNAKNWNPPNINKPNFTYSDFTNDKEFQKIAKEAQNKETVNVPSKDIFGQYYIDLVKNNPKNLNERSKKIYDRLKNGEKNELIPVVWYNKNKIAKKSDAGIYNTIFGNNYLQALVALGEDNLPVKILKDDFKTEHKQRIEEIKNKTPISKKETTEQVVGDWSKDVESTAKALKDISDTKSMGGNKYADILDTLLPKEKGEKIQTVENAILGNKKSDLVEAEIVKVEGKNYTVKYKGKKYVIPKDVIGFSKERVSGLPQEISESYHKAKADGSNPELVKAVEELLGKPKVVEVKETTPEVKEQPPIKEETKDLGTKARELAKDLREGKKNVLPKWMRADLPDGTQKAGLDINEAYAKALETFADIHDATKDFAKAVEEGIKHIKEYFDDNNIPYKESELKKNFEAEMGGEKVVDSELPPTQPKGTEGSDGGDGGKKPPIGNEDLFGEGEDGRRNEKEFDKLTSKIPNENGEVGKYLSGETIQANSESELRNAQDIVKQKLVDAFQHGQDIVTKAKELFGEKEYVQKTLEYLDREKLDPHMKALIHVSLENEMEQRVAADPTNLGEQKLQDLVREKSQAFLRSNSLAINMGRARRLAKVGYDITQVTDDFFSPVEKEQKDKVQNAVQANAETIQKNYEESFSQKAFDQKVKEEAERLRKEERKLERSEKRAAVHKKIDAITQKWIDKLSPKTTKGTQAQGVTTETILKSVGATMKAAYDAGESIATVVQKGIEVISEKLEQIGVKLSKEDKEGLANDYEKTLLSEGSESRRDKLATAEQNLQQRINDIRQEIITGEREAKKTKQPLNNKKLIQLREEKAALEALRDKYLPKEKDIYSDEKAKATVEKKLLKEIEDLNKQINKGVKDLKEDKPSIESEQLDKLRAERDARAAILDAIDPDPKLFTEQALIENGYGKKIKVKTKNGVEEREVLDWTKLAGEEGSIDNVRDKVEQSLKDKGYSAEEISRMKDAFEIEYNNLREGVIEKSLNALNTKNKETLTSAQKAAARKLAELYNYGLFEKDPAEFQHLLGKAIGLKDISSEKFAQIAELGEAMSKAYRKEFNGKKLTDRELTSLDQQIDQQIRQILQNAAYEQGTKSFKFLSKVRELFGFEQRMGLHNLKQIIENPLSGIEEVTNTKLQEILRGNVPKDFKKIRRNTAISVFKDMVLHGGMQFGDINTQFVNRGNIDNFVNKLSDKQLWHGIASALTGKAHLDAMDSMMKSYITNAKFTQNLITVLTKDRLIDGKVEKGMSKQEAKNYVAENLYGQSYVDAVKTAKEIIADINAGKNFKVVGDSEAFVTRLANDIVTASLVKQGKITEEMVTAAYNAGYSQAGRGLGHVANNLFSEAIQGVSGKVETEINDAVKNKEWDKASKAIAKGILANNILFRYAAGGTNWVALKLEKMGLGIVSGLYLKNKTNIDITTNAGIGKLEKDLYNEGRALDAISRGTIGLLASAAYTMAYAILTDDKDKENFEKWRENNKWADKYIQVLQPMWANIYQWAISAKKGTAKAKDAQKMIDNLFNKRDDNYTIGGQLTNAIANKVRGNDEDAAGNIGQAGGQLFTTPVPWRTARDIGIIWKGAKGEEPYKVDASKPKSLAQGLLRGGLIDYAGLAPKSKIGSNIQFTPEQIKSNPVLKAFDTNKIVIGSTNPKQVTIWDSKLKEDKKLIDFGEEIANKYVKEHDKKVLEIINENKNSVVLVGERGSVMWDDGKAHDDKIQKSISQLSAGELKKLKEYISSKATEEVKPKIIEEIKKLKQK